MSSKNETRMQTRHHFPIIDWPWSRTEIRIYLADNAPAVISRTDCVHSEDRRVPDYLQTCRRCGATGFGIDEFTSPYTGLCAECNERYEAGQRLEQLQRGKL